ncbi:Rpn family recombination-promoting nuclease/putative transposase [Brachyspira hyodysenteriae]|uniref:Rpn family recombination-promoting nuclease/putative transposase n=1 Tax=Brachyspira hyodysenteriae TaxID=159 RepID=UPI0022CD49F1|nr:Rpn family recombination-promoting nuclease/putative transposase [Brachyspira hyodysenteriae]MCZ9838634.1 Rpn family recombination-promoting nuclease/putative transposase [Brachyspira hyodysenteriae]MCZ9847937.1 Rpn family recombination-promoting nuclease/putative transposase [Brachyspira hyodysenteriae]MCZ9851638.1 Rpn family recombination-promoting nuclease/putative transposase [Brachyspira hyodysenteriae]MCZ9859623.1 Rpn family recombination-promoting nuclease/putative transposase [Brachy
MRNINVLNDYFVRYLLSSPDSNPILLDFINSIMLDSNMKTFRSVEILTPFNYKENYEDKETIADVKCITQNGTVVIIEIQLQGNSRFPERILYYWASNYSKLLKHGEKYDALTPVISINLLNFNLDDNDSVHSCYMIYDSINKRLLTDHLQIHILELKKFKYNSLEPDLNCWLKFFTMKEKDNKEVIMSELVKEKPIMEEVQKRYNNFIKDRLMMNEYDKRETYLYGNQIMLEEERRLGLEEGIKQGIEQGIEQGEKNKAISMAKNMKARDMDINLISELTGLSIQEIKNL